VSFVQITSQTQTSSTEISRKAEAALKFSETTVVATAFSKNSIVRTSSAIASTTLVASSFTSSVIARHTLSVTASQKSENSSAQSKLIASVPGESVTRKVMASSATVSSPEHIGIDKASPKPQTSALEDHSSTASSEAPTETTITQRKSVTTVSRRALWSGTESQAESAVSNVPPDSEANHSNIESQANKSKTAIEPATNYETETAVEPAQSEACESNTALKPADSSVYASNAPIASEASTSSIESEVYEWRTAIEPATKELNETNTALESAHSETSGESSAALGPAESEVQESNTSLYISAEIEANRSNKQSAEFQMKASSESAESEVYLWDEETDFDRSYKIALEPAVCSILTTEIMTLTAGEEPADGSSAYKPISMLTTRRKSVKGTPTDGTSNNSMSTHDTTTIRGTSNRSSTVKREGAHEVVKRTENPIIGRRDRHLLLELDKMTNVNGEKLKIGWNRSYVTSERSSLQEVEVVQVANEPQPTLRPPTSVLPAYAREWTLRLI